MIRSFHRRFYAAGFILYFPSDDPYWRWLPGHKSILIITAMFIWLALIVCMFLFVQSTLVWAILKRRYGDTEDYHALNDLEEEDDDDDDQVFVDNRTKSHTSNNHRLKAMKSSNGQTTNNHSTTAVQMHHHDEDSDSQIEFDQRQPYSSKI